MTTEIFKCVAGSRLFGTNNADSDTDYKAVHLPTARSILLGTANAVQDSTTGDKDIKNTADDVDSLSLPLQRYLKSLAKMETNAIEMLFAPSMSPMGFVWQQVLDHRFKIMSSKKDCFVGYAKGQAMRYAVRGDRLQALEAVLQELYGNPSKERIIDCDNSLQRLARIKHVKVYEKVEPGGFVVPYLSVFGREVPATVKVSEAISVFEKPVKEAGKRARQAAEGAGPDWKGLYHACRIVEEGIELFSTGELIFPCRYAPYFKMIRNGERSLEYILQSFEERLEELQGLTPIDSFRDTPNNEWIDEFVACVHEQVVVGDYEDWANH